MTTVDKQIEINVLRISPDGKLIEFILNCPEDYHFTDFIINIEGSSDYYSIKDSVFGENTDSVEGAFEVSTVGGGFGSIYHIKLIGEINSSAKLTGIIYDPIESEAWISDVSQIYNCLIDDIVAFDSNCGDVELLNRVIRNYLLLYAHQEALRLGYLEEALNWLNKLNKCFTKCGERQDKRNLTCGCQHPAVQSNCGCKR